MTNQNDFVIDNGTGFAVRQDIQDALQALAGNSSGNSEPSVKYAYQWWADTNANVMKLRNSSNNGWIELFQLDGTLTLEDGSASAPALSFRDDPNTGIYSAANDRFNIAVGGTDYLEIKSDVIVFNDTGADTDFKIEGDTDANLFYVDAGNNRIGIGTSTPQVLMHLHQNGARLQFTNTNTGSGATDGIIMGINGDNDFFINNQEDNEHILFFTEGNEVARFTDTKKFLVGTSTASTVGNSQYAKLETSGNTSSATGAGAFVIKAGTVSASQTNGNTLGRLVFSTLDGGDYAFIQASIDANPGSNDFPGRMMFFTCANDASTATERMRIKSDGDVSIIDGNLIMGNDHGIDFSAAGGSASGSSNALLDDYEEGTWTPAIGYQNSSGLTISTNSHSGKYTKIGRLVHCIGAVNWTVSGSPVNDNVFVSGLPFNTSTGQVGTNSTRFAGCNITINNTSDNTSIYMAGAYGNFAINLGVQQDMGNRANELGGNSGMIVMLQIWYHTE